MMKKLLLTALALIMVLALMGGCSAIKEKPAESGDVPKTPANVATLAGPTGMGLIELFDNPAYNVNLFTSPDQITPKVINGEMDVATIPSNVAAVLYNKLKGGVSIVGVNTMGVLYIVENGQTINSINDLAGKTIYATGQGSTPEYALQKILDENGLDDVTVEYMGAHADLANALVTGKVSIALLPEPFVSTVLAKNPALSVRIDINEEWKKIFGEDAGMPMGVTIVSKAFAQDKEAMRQLIDDYSASVDFVTNETDSAAALIAAREIVGSEAVAKQAIPRCGISFVTGEAAKAILADYFAVMFESNPESLGGSMPDDGIYYMP